MASDLMYTEHFHDPSTEDHDGLSWPVFAIPVALLLIVFWAAL